MTCCWASNISDEECRKPRWDTSDYCLFHKPEKNLYEATLFWGVVNIDYFQYLPESIKNLLEYGLQLSPQSLDNFPELYRISATGIIQMVLNNEQSTVLGQALRAAREQYVLEVNDENLARKILELYDIAHLHGCESGFFKGYCFPEVGNQTFNYIVKPSGMGNLRGFCFEEATFEACASFKDYNFGEEFVRFKSCIFKREINFSGAQFNNWVDFDKCNLSTGHSIFGSTPFKNTTFDGDYLHFKGGSLCTLSGLKLSEHTDLIIDNDVVIDPKQKRGVGDYSQFRNIRDEIFFIAKRQAERTGNITLLGKYEDNLRRYRFDYITLRDDLIDILSVMQKRRPSGLDEDQYNDFIKDALHFKNYIVLDQTRGGASASGKKAGELDIEVCNEFNVPFSILEALCLKSVTKKVIVSHLNKLLNRYDRSGHKTNFIIVYCNAKRFNTFVSNYTKFIKDDLNEHSDFEDDCPLSDTVEIPTEKTDLRMIECTHTRQGKNVSVMHLLVKMSN